LVGSAHADIRCCKEPERNSTGNIVRSKAVVAEFIAAQEPLGEEFSKILYENMWYLYES